MEIIESSLRTTRHRVAVKRERVDNIESTMKTHERQLTVKRARLDKLERRQSLHTSQIKAIHTKLRTMQGYERRIMMPLTPSQQQHDDVQKTENELHVACSNADLETTRHIIQTHPYLLHSVDNNGWNSALHAARGGNVQILKLLIEKGVDAKCKNNENSNILQVACIHSNLEMSRYIIRTYPELLHSVDNNGTNVALNAAIGGNVRILKLMTENDVNGKHQSNDGRNILHVACRYSNLEMSRYIIETYPDLLHGINNGGWNAAMYAAQGGNVKILQLLADEELNIKHKDHDGRNILHMACRYSNLEMSRYIIQTYPDLLHSVDNDGWNAALHTSCGVNIKILQLLSNYGVEVKHKSNFGCSILHEACFSSNVEMIRHIIQTYPDLLHSVDNYGRNTALHAAAGGKVEILQLLADNEVDVKHKRDDGLNILHVACTLSKLEMSRYIAKTYPDLLHSVDNDGSNAVLHAARGGDVNILQLLANKGVDIKHKNDHMLNILHMSCKLSNLEMSRHIIKTYPDLLHSVDQDGWNAALHATMGGNIETLQLLADNEVDVKCQSKDGSNILHVACQYSNLEMSRYIIETYPDLLHSVDGQGENAALHAASGGNVKILQLLARKEVCTKTKSNLGLNILHIACDYSNFEMCRYIVETYPDLLHSVDNDRRNAALHAASGGNVKILQLLADKQVNVNKESIRGLNILHIACANSKLEMSRYIIQIYPDLLHSVDKNGCNAALHAASGGNVRILQLLADNEVDVKMKNKRGRNILHIACANSKLEMSRYIIEIYPDLLHSVDKNGWNAALHAASGGNVKILQLLADKQVNVNKESIGGLNILHIACANSKLEMSRYIIQTYPDFLDSVDNDGWNAALHAAAGGNDRIIQLLADIGVHQT